jgi:hypothetical protein
MINDSPKISIEGGPKKDVLGTQKYIWGQNVSYKKIVFIMYCTSTI